MERIVGLTAADRLWMDDVVRTVEESWGVVSELSTRTCVMLMKGRWGENDVS